MKKLAIFALLLVVGIFIFSQFTSDEHYAAATETEDRSLALRPSSLPIRVSGIVSASETAVVSAKAAGVIERYAVVEGQYVYPGNLLVEQFSPVTAAELSLRTAEHELTLAQQTAAVDATDTTALQATVVAKSTAELAVLDATNKDNRVQEAAHGLLAADEAAITAILSAVRFIDTNRSFFDASSLRTYETVIADLYGTIPSHLNAGIVQSTASTDDITGRIEKLRATDTPSVSEVLNVHALIAAQLQSLITVYEGAERDMLDRQQAGLSPAVRDAYFTERTAITSSQANLISSNVALRTALDTAAASQTTSDQQIDISIIDKAAAERQATYSAAIAAAAANVSAAATSVTTAQQAQSAVRATFAGIVVERYKEAGEYVAPGEPLLKISGTAGKELRVTVPEVFATTLAPGLHFFIRGEQIGTIDRFSPISNGHALEVIIALSDTTLAVGTTLVGELELASSNTIYAIPRAYISFTNFGAIVTTTDDEAMNVEIIYDAGDLLYITGKNLTAKTVQPHYSLNL